MAEATLDATDHEILALLREDARRTLSDIASRVTLSTAAVKRRIDRLQELGVILGYTVQLDHAKLGRRGFLHRHLLPSCYHRHDRSTPITGAHSQA